LIGILWVFPAWLKLQCKHSHLCPAWTSRKMAGESAGETGWQLRSLSSLGSHRPAKGRMQGIREESHTSLPLSGALLSHIASS
jgi:hypothetical protein